jgi:hypothetical protein
MSDEIIKKTKDSLLSGTRNVFEAYGNAAATGGPILGQLLKFTKGDYLVGRGGEECSEKELVAVVPGILHGHIRWENNVPVEQVMGPLIEGFVPPARSTLGHDDKSLWEIDSKSGKPRDPWQPGLYMPMVSVDASNVYTFSTGSDGGRRHAIGPLCQEYGAHIRQHPNEFPIVKLEQDSYLHSDRTIGRVKFPLFPVQRWAVADKYIAAITAITGRPVKLLEYAV